MTINGSEFIFDGSSSDEYGVVLGYIGSPNIDSKEEETNIITSKSLFKDRWDLHFVEDATPLQFKITVVRNDAELIDSNMQRALKKWLCKKKRAWLQIIQDDLSNVYYRCLITNPKPNNINGKTYGYDFDIICDSGHAWSELKSKPYTCNGTLNINMNFTFDYDEYILYPILIISPLEDTVVEIINNTTNQVVEFGYLFADETVVLDCESDRVSSSSGRVLINTWNKKNLGLIEGKNSITLNGNFRLDIKYRLPIRVGG